MTIDAWLIVARWLHVLAVSLLFGAALFPFYGVEKTAAEVDPALRRLPRLLMWSAALALISGLVWFIVAFGSMFAAAQNRLVWVWIVRLTLAAALTFVLAAGRRRWHDHAVLAGSAILLVSLAGLSHDGTQSGAAAAVHIAVDVIHLVASGVWVGALVILALMLGASARQRSHTDSRIINDALARFSGVGPGIVIALVLSGIANSGLIGPQNALQSFSSTYSQVLVAKIGLFVLMLLLAAANRYWLTAKLQSALALKTDTQASIHALAASIVAETLLAVLVLAAVGWLGVLTPPG